MRVNDALAGKIIGRLLFGRVMDDPLIGSVLEARFKILALLGKGAMSSVYKAEDVLIRRIVAVKVLNWDSETAETNLKRFQQEAVLLSKVKHPNVVTVHRFGKSEDGRMYLVLDYVEGQTLAELIAKEGRLNAERVVRLFLQVCDGLATVHKLGIIHRDLKPGNLMVCLDEDGQELIKIVDFGMARSVFRADQHLTESGKTLGSPLYMSPEQWRSSNVKETSDVYSLACVVYEALSGKPPLGMEQVLSLWNADSRSAKAPVAKLDGIVSRKFGEIILKAMRISPEDRYQSVELFAHDLKSIAGSAEPAKTRIENKYVSCRTFLIRTGLIWPVALLPVLITGWLAYHFLFTYQGQLQVLSSRIAFEESRNANSKSETYLADLVAMVPLLAHCGEIEKAEVLCERVLQLYEEKSGVSLELAFMCDRLARSLSDVNSAKGLAKRYFQRATGYLAGLLLKDNSLYRSDKVCQTWLNDAELGFGPHSMQANTARIFLASDFYKYAERSGDSKLLLRSKKLFNEIVKTVDPEEPKTIPFLAKANAVLATLCATNGDERGAREKMLAALKLCSQLRPDAEPYVTDTFNLAGAYVANCNKLKQFNTSESILREAESATKAIYGNKSKEASVAILQLAHFYFGRVIDPINSSNYPLNRLAAKKYKEGIEIVVTEPAHTEQVAWASISLGHCLIWTKDYDPAMKYLTLCKACCEKLGSRMDTTRLTVCHDLLDIYMAKKQERVAEQFCKTLIAQLESERGKEDPDLLPFYHRLAVTAAVQNKSAEAKNALSRALEIGGKAQMNPIQIIQYEQCKKLLSAFERGGVQSVRLQCAKDSFR